MFKKAFHDGTLGIFVAVVTFSSMEHSGLGRYGDALDPWADVFEIARAWCLCKDGGSLTIAVMYGAYPKGFDEIRLNAGRWYGLLRWPYLTSNWKQHWRGSGAQGVHVFTKATAHLPITPSSSYIASTESKTVLSSEQAHLPITPPSAYNAYSGPKIVKPRGQTNQPQDKFVWDSLKSRKNGTFIDMGGYDGVSLSNSVA